MRHFNWSILNLKLISSFQKQKLKNLQSRKIDVEPVFGFMKAILGFTRMSV